jgi:DNA/RNA-binding domain of Phe-tRNA-synthetase-like protein
MISIRIRLGSVSLGLVEADEVHVEPAPSGLREELVGLAGKLARQLTVETLAQDPTACAIRGMFRAWGLDPSKYRPSSEALLRRVAQGKGISFVSNLVDIVNLGSIETGWPYGCYDRDRISPPVEFRLGLAGETYHGVGRRVWHLAGRPVLADAEGPFGSPISDSTRTMVTGETRAVAVVIFAPTPVPFAQIETALGRVGERLAQWAAAGAVRQGILRGEKGEVA